MAASKARPPFHLSATRLQDGCDFHYQQTELLGVEEYKAANATEGTLFHSKARLYGIVRARRNVAQSVDLYYACASYVERRAGKRPDDLTQTHHLACDNFARAHKLDLSAGIVHHFERRFAFDRAWAPCDPKAKIDRFGFEADHIADKPAERSAIIEEYKGGFQEFDYQSAGNHQQGKDYCACWLLLHPGIESVTLKLWGPLFGKDNTSSESFGRDIVEPFMQRVEGRFAQLDSLWAKFGRKPMPARACFGCRFCGVPCEHEAVKNFYARLTSNGSHAV